MRLWRSRTSGIVLACCLIAGTNLYSLIAVWALRVADDWVGHTQQVMITLQQAREAARNADIAQSSYLATRDPRFLETYHRAADSGAAVLRAARALTADNPAQQIRLDAIEAIVQSESQLVRSQIEQSPPRNNTSEAAQFTDHSPTDQIREALAGMQDAEQDLLRSRTATVVTRATVAEVASSLGTIGSVLLIALIFRLMAREATIREAQVSARTAELANANAALRRNEARLRGHQEQLQILIESTPAAIAMFDREMRYLAVSHRFLKDYRLGEQSVIGRSHYEIFPEIPEHWRAAYRRCLTGEPFGPEEEPFPRADGSIDWVRWHVVPWHESDGSVGGIILLSEVITDRRQAEAALARSEAQLRQTQKMEMIGQLTGGIAHDFNNMLAIIIGDVELLLDSLQHDPDAVVLAAEVLKTAEAGAGLTRRLLAFARRQTLQPAAIDLRAYLPSLVSMLKRVIGENIRLTETLPAGLWLARADQTQVGEALLNLVINARDAMPRGGEIAIEVGNAHLDDQYCAQNAEVTPGDYVLLSVTDPGVGMSPDVIEHAIEPFFTTKEVGHGTGLGLSMVYGFAKQSGGHLKIYSEVGTGTTVRLYLPRAPSVEPALSGVRAPEPKPLGGTESILVVDDNVRMRQVAARQLEALGYRVTTAENGPAVLRALQSGERFDLIFSDVVMSGGMSGYELAAIVRQDRPDLKILLTTGYAAMHGTIGGRNDHPIEERILRKPYRRHDLAQHVRAALDDLPPPNP